MINTVKMKNSRNVLKITSRKMTVIMYKRLMGMVMVENNGLCIISMEAKYRYFYWGKLQVMIFVKTMALKPLSNCQCVCVFSIDLRRHWWKGGGCFWWFHLLLTMNQVHFIIPVSLHRKATQTALVKFYVCDGVVVIPRWKTCHFCCNGGLDKGNVSMHSVYLNIGTSV